jgi:uncharacterized protein YlbG (UPF0298 family)
MARARNIKPGFFQNEELAELEPINRLAFIALWTVCDYKGCLEYRPKRLKVQLLPYDNVDIEKIMINLEQSGFIKIYSVEEQNYIKILNFEKHQNPHPNEIKSGSKIPDFDENAIEINVSELVAINHDKNGTSHADSLLLIPDSLNPLTDSTPKVIKREKWEDDFDIFWQEYPKKKDKQAAKLVWKKIRPNLQDVLKALSWQKQSKEWFEQGGKFVKHPERYIKNHSWLDEPSELVTF